MATKAGNDKVIEAIVTRTVTGLDEPMAEYISRVIADDPWMDAHDLYGKIGEMLFWFQLAKNEASAQALCSKLLLELQKAGVFDDETKEEREKRDAARERQKIYGWTPAQEKDRSKVVVGSVVRARYVDGKYYRAIVNKVNSDDSFVVTYSGYGNSEYLKLRDLKLPGPKANLNEEEEEETENTNGSGTSGNDDKPKLLTTPVRIADFGEQKEVKEEDKPVENQGESTEGPSKRELRAMQKEKRKLELAKQREVKRAEREQSLKLEALKTYLSMSTLHSSRSRSIDIHVNNYNLSSPDGSKELLENASFSLNMGRRYGLIGSNGVGKTTLLKAISHYEINSIPTHLRIIHVEQECRGDNYSALQTVLKNDIEREILLYEENRLKKILEGGDDTTNTNTNSSGSGNGEGEEVKKTDAEVQEEKKWSELHALMTSIDTSASTADPQARLQQVYARMEAIDAWGAEARATSILSGLQFTPERMKMPTKSLSGGWRMRVALAAALFVQPDLLLLDEPTNHLDFPAVLWLENYLNNYAKTLVVISHDRVFLNNVITDVLHFHKKQLTTYRGNYTTFEKVRQAMIRQQQREFEAQEAKKEHIQEFIDRFRVNANRAAMVQSRIKTLAKMDNVEAVEEEAVFKMQFPAPSDIIEHSVVEIKECDFSYNGQPPYLLSNVNAYVGMDTRVGILGANGVGKSTLINLIIGKLQPTNGLVHINSHARIATFAQHHMDKLKPNMTPLDLLMELFPRNHPMVIRRHLGKFGCSGQLQTQLISSLSGGQKSRVAFAIMTWDKPHVLVMDEPTNHLDLETVDALIEAVNDYKGGLVVVSHDQHFLSSVCKEFWSVSDGQVKRFSEFTDARKFGYSNVAKA